jgi:hypothetical protein
MRGTRIEKEVFSSSKNTGRRKKSKTAEILNKTKSLTKILTGSEDGEQELDT